jgi:hypothetical protein
MARVTYDKQLSALLAIDPYNDSFLREANYGIASRLLQTQTVVFLIWCRC